MEDNQAQTALAAHVGKLLRDSFGKGPQAVFVNVHRPCVVIHLKQFVTPTERILLVQGQESAVEHTRDLLMQKLIPEVKAFVHVLLGMEIGEFYYDWSFHNGSGVMVGIESAADMQESGQVPDEDYPKKMELHAEIEAISIRLERKPLLIRSCRINSRTLLIMRCGILVSIEKELLRLGHEETLKLAKRSLEKRYMHSDIRLDPILQTMVTDIFVDWEFHLDKSVMVLIHQPIA